MYGQVFKGGVLKSFSECSFSDAKYEAKKAEGCVGLAIYERDVYLDGSKGDENQKILLFGSVLTISRSKAIEINNRDKLGYINLEKIETQEYYYIPSYGVLFF